jgi:3-deoxy-manno-octulosonate cytidylyltransferase (CMP-KDO synthetase)
MAPDSLSVIGVVPARLGSTRLPEKMLADIHGRPLIVWTASAALQSGAFSRVIVATDHERILRAVQEAGFEAVLTDPALPSGSARVAAVARTLTADVFVNIQGDEPVVDGTGLKAVVAAFQDPAVEMATLSFPLRPEDESNPNVVKLVTDARHNALYFSRSLIPFPRSRDGFRPLKHLGVYGYRRATLLRLMELPPADLERIESLEQLRALYYGISLRVIPAVQDSVGVDTQADLDRVRELLVRRNS